MSTNNTNKKVLYLRWRPQLFNEVIGQEHVTTTLKNVFKHYKKFQERSRKQKHYVKTNFSFDNMKDLVETVLDEHVPEFAEQVELKLPDLNLPKLEKVK